MKGYKRGGEKRREEKKKGERGGRGWKRRKEKRTEKRGGKVREESKGKGSREEAGGQKERRVVTKLSAGPYFKLRFVGWIKNVYWVCFIYFNIQKVCKNISSPYSSIDLYKLSKKYVLLKPKIKSNFGKQIAFRSWKQHSRLHLGFLLR